MIVNSSYVRADEAIVRHLLNVANNERVDELREFDRDVPWTMTQTIRNFESLRQLNGRAKIGCVHVFFSPDHELTQEELEHTLDLIDREHDIEDHARKVVRHGKGERANHFHIIYAAIGPDGRAASSRFNHRRDELIGRQLEIAFGERVLAGVHCKAVAEILRARGQEREADIVLSRGKAKQERRPISLDMKQQAHRAGIDATEVHDLIFAAWNEVTPLRSFRDALVGRGIVVGTGRKADVLVALHKESGLETPLRRALRKETGLRSADLRLLFPNARPLAEIAKENLAGAGNSIQMATMREMTFASVEALTAGELPPTRWKARGEGKGGSKTAQWKLQRENKRRHAKLRQERIDRALARSRALGNPFLRLTLASMAGAGLMLAGTPFLAVFAAYWTVRVGMKVAADRAHEEAVPLIAARNAEREILRTTPRPKRFKLPPYAASTVVQLTPSKRIENLAPPIGQTLMWSKMPAKVRVVQTQSVQHERSR